MYKVLYVEDNFENFKLVDFVLSKKGFEVFNAIDGIEAIEKAEKIMPDIIVMDINLPNLMGYEVTAMIKQTDYLKDIPIVALTAAYSDDYKQLSLEAGCVEYFTKPIEPLSFSESIKDIIENRKQYGSELEGKLIDRKISDSLLEKARKVMHLNNQLLKNESRFEKILSSVSDLIFLLDNQMNIKFYNNSVLKSPVFIKNYSEEKKFFDIFDIGSQNVNKIRQDIDNERPLSNVELILKDYQKPELYVANFSYIEDEIVVSLRSVKNEIEMGGHIMNLEKLASVGQVTAGIIHEINNPLTAIKTFFEILRMKYLSPMNDEDLNKIVSRIDHGFNKIEALSKSLLSFAKPSAEKKYLTNLNHVIKEVIDFGEYEIKRGTVELELQLDENIPYIEVVKSQMDQSLLNILINANHALRNTDKPKITVKTYFDDTFVYIDISNNGPKIPEDIRSHIFEPFFSTKGTDEGTGLGLAIVRQIMNRHEGEISLKSDENLTTFTLKFNKILRG